MLSKNVERWIEDWKAEGEAKGRRSVAEKLIAEGMPISQVSKITELSEEEVRALSDTVIH